MDKIITSLPGTLVSIGLVITIIVGGLLYILGLWKKGRDGEDDRLITILQKTVTELEKKVDQQSTDIENLSIEVQELKRDNKKYIEIFQGRNEETVSFQKQGIESMKRLDEVHDIITTIAESIKNTNSAMEKLITLIGKSMDIAGDIAKK